MSKIVAAALVFVCSAAVLMLEILAGRLLAPYVGISLETYTSIIGTVLAGIAVGAWGGGKLADRIDPRRLLGPSDRARRRCSRSSPCRSCARSATSRARAARRRRSSSRSPRSSSPPSC